MAIMTLITLWTHFGSISRAETVMLKLKFFALCSNIHAYITITLKNPPPFVFHYLMTLLKIYSIYLTALLELSK